ncbi:bZIP transcription factor [Aspergillus lucknowensis]|uniref:BZIP domain-containing protein n=1 Tax=Aspergillus lucknowensis TaxID=176173 RepID=A0ABR4M1Q1_9EURO
MPAQTPQGKKGSENKGKEKRKPVRRDPEKRREQNLRAQRKYREKLRERLDRLEALAEAAARSRGVENPPAVGTVSSKAAGTPAGGLSSSTTHPAAENLPSLDAAGVSAPSVSMANRGECQQFFPQSYEISSELAIWDPTTQISHFDEIPSVLGMWDTTAYTPQPDQPPSLALQCPSTHDTPSALSISDSTTLLSQSKPTPSALTSLDSPTHVDPSLITRGTYNDAPGLWWTTTFNCGCSKPHFQIQSKSPQSFSCGDFRVIRLQPSAPAADPYANNIRIDVICTISALFTLSDHVGIAEDVLCMDEAPSPFFRSDAESADNTVKENIVSTVRELFKKTLKPDLRPNKEQITVKHHPAIDIMPFPTLRKNLIIHQEEYDEDEFFHDFLTGLVCWGGAGIGKRDRDTSTGFVSTGTPWDFRSWEARTWFLKKYWALLGGDEGEIPRQTEWWRSIRGDEALEIEALG